MTKDEILAMKPGRDLDRLVAEKIFDCDTLTARVGLHEDGDIEYCWGYPLGHDVAPNYSTDIAAAWEVVEEMHKKEKFTGCRACLEIHGTSFDGNNDDETGGKWLACILGEEVWGDTAQEAICKAALLAVMDIG